MSFGRSNGKKARFGFVARTSFKDGLRETIGWYQRTRPELSLAEHDGQR